MNGAVSKENQGGRCEGQTMLRGKISTACRFHPVFRIHVGP